MTTYAEYESSLESGAPLELYRVMYGSEVITLGSGDISAVHAGETYTPSTIKRSELSQTQEMNKAVLMLTTSKNNAIAELFRTGAPEFPVFITVFRQHSDLAGSDFIVAYKGRITSCRFTVFEAELNCEPIFTSLKRPGLRIKYEPTCANGLYDVGCTVNKEAYAVQGVVAVAQSRRVFTIDAAGAFPSGYFVGGILVLQGQHMIAEHIGNVITLIRHSVAKAGDPLTLYPGCDHQRMTCLERFNNVNNYKGFPWMADRNPFIDRTIHYIS